MRKKAEQTKKMSKNQRRLTREAQVRRQKAMIGVLITLLLLIIIVILFMKTAPKEKRYEVNSACNAYRSQVEREAEVYGMSDYVELIMALMMQESSGNGPDVLQSSEGAFNTKYPQEPGGIKDTTYSIQCGIQELKYAMDKAGVTSPTDMDAIRLALQAYNFGADGYFSFMEENGWNQWSVESAEAFAQMASGNTQRKEDDPMRDPAGPWAYGDQRYPEHVLRYYHPGKD